MHARICETIHGYRVLDWWVDAFFRDGGPRFVVIVGPPGVAKSHRFRTAMPKEALYLSGALTAFHLYTQLHEYRDRPVVIDDVDALFRDTAAVNLLKCLCNTEVSREVYWGKRTKQLDDEDIPRRFSTASRVCILANEIKHIDANLGAVLDRAFVLNFTPSVEEVHRETGTWFTDREVYDFIGTHLALIPFPSMRLYVHAAELKRLGTECAGTSR